jgi:pilus assembly protein CpaE
MLQSAAGHVNPVASLQQVPPSAGAGNEHHVVVIDVRDQAVAPTALAALRRTHPSAAIILVTVRLEPAMMLEAIRTGVSEFLADPLTIDEVRAALDRVSSLASGHAAKIGKLYAFVGAKGGVGTTTVAVNVATTLARARAGRVLMVDLHPAYGDAALFFGAEPRFSVLDALDNTHRLDAAYLKGLITHTKSGVDLLASSDRVRVTAVETHRVRTLLEFLARSYDHLILDVPRSDSAILDAFEGVANIVIVANQELSTVRGAARMATTMRQRYGKERVQIVISRFDTVAEIRQEDIERATGGPVHHLFPSNYRLAVDALNKGQPIVVENHNKLAAAFVGFARSLAGIKKIADTEAPKPAGLLGRLTGRH